MAQLWGMMNNLASLTLLSLIAVNIPGPARFISKSLIAFAQFDIFPTDYFIHNILKLQYQNDDQQALTPQLEDYGFGDISTTLNMGSAMVFCLILAAEYLVLAAVLKPLSSKGQFFLKHYLKLRSSLFWGELLVLVQQQYLTFFLSSLIYSIHFQARSQSGDLLDEILTLLLIVISGLYPVASLAFLYRNQKHLESKEFQTRYAPLLE